ncbi:MAG: hypothetical protein IPO08_23745 [Xanthomonadales bacterium]|nr:hypothetical protein [Xanthomonadales bacterium]
MQAITNFDCQPRVFQVMLIKSDHRTGFTAVIEFRSTHAAALSSISAHDPDPRQALQTLYDQLCARWGKCLVCGAYRSEPIEKVIGG